MSGMLKIGIGKHTRERNREKRGGRRAREGERGGGGGPSRSQIVMSNRIVCQNLSLEFL